jgi:hypothetical protein
MHEVHLGLNSAPTALSDMKKVSRHAMLATHHRILLSNNVRYPRIMHRCVVALYVEKRADGLEVEMRRAEKCAE